MAELSEIYAVESGCYSDYQVHALFHDHETAEAWAHALRTEADGWHRDARVSPFPLVPEKTAPFLVTTFRQDVELWDDGRTETRGMQSRTEYPISSLWGMPPKRPCIRYVRAPCHKGKGGRLEVRGDSAEAVGKVVSERIAMWKAGAWAGPQCAEITEGGDVIDPRASPQ